MTDYIEDIEEQDDDTGQLYEHLRIVVDKGQVPVRIDRFMTERLQHSSRNRIQKAADLGFVHVNERPVKSNYKVRPGDVITLMLDRPHHDTTIEAEEIPLDVVYEDEALMVINKPAGMVVHPGAGNFNGTLINAVAWHLRNMPSFDANDPEVGLVHRIDKDTSGLEGNIGRDPRDRLRMAVFPPDSETGKPAVTHYRVLERFGYVTFVECILETGRTHQIRAHMKHIGHPMFGDERYGGIEILRGERSSTYKAYIQNCFKLCPRQALHARTLGFVHPTTGQQMDFTSPIPQDMEQLLDKWRNYIKGLAV